MNRQQTRALVRIREMIVRGELRAGDRLAEAPLAERLGISRTPVRQALPVLAQEGLLAEHETRGYIVRGFSRNDILDAIDLRGALEGLAARRVAEQGPSRSCLQALNGCLEDGDQLLAQLRTRKLSADKAETQYVDLNARFHAAIVREANSAILTQALERNAHIPFAGPQALVFDRKNAERMAERMAYAHRQHHCIVSALEQGESARVEALMREHATPAKESLDIPSSADPRELRPRLSVVR